MLRARKPEAVNKRLKLFMYGPAGVSKLSVVVENFQFVGGRDEASGPGSRGADVFGNEKPWRTPGANANAEETPADAAAPQRKRRARTAQLPFGEEKQFEEADIPF